MGFLEFDRGDGDGPGDPLPFIREEDGGFQTPTCPNQLPLYTEPGRYEPGQKSPYTPPPEPPQTIPVVTPPGTTSG